MVIYLKMVLSILFPEAVSGYMVSITKSGILVTITRVLRSDAPCWLARGERVLALCNSHDCAILIAVCVQFILVLRTGARECWQESITSIEAVLFACNAIVEAFWEGARIVARELA